MAMEERILQKLEEVEQEGRVSPGLMRAYRDLLQVQARAKKDFAASKADSTAAIGSEAICERLGQRIPLLSFNDLALDWEQVRSVLQEVTVVLAKDAQEPSAEIEGLKNIASDRPLLQYIVKLWYEGSSLSPIATDSIILSSVIQAALKPFLALHAEALLPKVNQESWRRRICPVCGGKPNFAFLDRERGARWLLCSRCDAEWLFQRLECPYCGSQDQDALAYFTDDQGLYRLYVCQRCRTYLKAIDLRRTTGEVLLPLEQLLTLDMDRQGQERGYRAGWTTNT
jgi:FdhE protein